jgi:hypothetical protein
LLSLSAFRFFSFYAHENSEFYAAHHESRPIKINRKYRQIFTWDTWVESFYQESYQALRVQWSVGMQQEDSLKQCRKRKHSKPQLNKAQTQVAQPQAAQGVQKPNQSKNDTLQELERLGSLKKQGLLTDDEFQTMKTRLISNAK